MQLTDWVFQGGVTVGNEGGEGELKGAAEGDRVQSGVSALTQQEVSQEGERKGGVIELATREKGRMNGIHIGIQSELWGWFQDRCASGAAVVQEAREREEAKQWEKEALKAFGEVGEVWGGSGGGDGVPGGLGSGGQTTGKEGVEKALSKDAKMNKMNVIKTMNKMKGLTKSTPVLKGAKMK